MNIFKQKGLTLVELMVSLVIGLIVTGVVMQVFISNRQTFQLQESMSRVQESGRLGLQVLADEIRHAGNGLMGVGSTLELCMLATDRCDALATRALVGRVSTGANNEVAGSDVISIGRADSCDARVDGDYNPNSANFKATKLCPSMRQGGILMLTDLKRSVIFEVTNKPSTNVTITHAGPGNVVSNKLGGVIFDPGARVMGFSSISFFVRETGAKDMNGNAMRALAIRDNLVSTAPVTDLLDGVEMMHVYYGVPTGGNMLYRRADAMPNADWERVTAVRLELLMVSDAATRDADSQSVQFGGADIAADGRFRQVYRTVVAIRGRI